MKLVCPKCKSEFRAGFTRCEECGVDLVDRDTLQQLERALDDPQAALADVPRMAVVHSTLPVCRRIVEVLLAAGVPAYVEAETEEGELLGAGGAPKVGVIIAERDLKQVGEVLKQRFPELFVKETMEAIDPTAESVTCPACGHSGALVDGACGDCGLFLGAPEA